MAYEYGPPSRPIEDLLTAIQGWLMQEYRAEFLPAPRRSPRRTRRLRRMRGWSRDIGRLVSGIGQVKRETLPRIERDIGYVFPDQDRFIRILMDRSTKRLFLGILAEFPEDALPVPARDIAILESISDDARALALIGDVTLRLKVLPGPRADVPGLAHLSDRWRLHESLIGLECRHRPAGRALEREKEILAGAVLGLLYVEGGIGALRAAVPLLAHAAGPA
ncbi:MAG: hypothetical protein GX885_03425 [Methanomicrobiales archaeon]|nr:hypothetical protein [Methanomicrobiales archaeon]